MLNRFKLPQVVFPPTTIFPSAWMTIDVAPAGSVPAAVVNAVSSTPVLEKRFILPVKSPTTYILPLLSTATSFGAADTFALTAVLNAASAVEIDPLAEIRFIKPAQVPTAYILFDPSRANAIVPFAATPFCVKVPSRVPVDVSPARFFALF